MKTPDWKTIVAATILTLFWGPIFCVAIYWVVWKFFIQTILIEDWIVVLIAILASLLGCVVWWAHHHLLGVRK